MSNSLQWFLIGALIVALAALGYIYYQDKNSISIDTGELHNHPTSTLG